MSGLVWLGEVLFMLRASVVMMMAVLVLVAAGCGSEHGGDQGGGSQGGNQISTPVRIALTDDHRLLASDYQAQTLLLFDSQTLTINRSLAVNGYPLAVGMHQGKIFVGNETKQCVEVYSSGTGEKLFDLGDGPGSIPVPNDLAIDTKYGRVFVVDSTAKRIAVFSVDGPLLYTITDPSLIRPTALALDESGAQLYVSDFGSRDFAPGVLVFNYDGSYVRRITGAFSRPQGLAMDGSGHLFLADALLGQVLVFDRASGQEMQRLGSLGTYSGPHKLPLDVVFDGVSQKIFVTDYLAGRIEPFATAEIAP